MGLPSRKHVDARHRHEPGCRPDRGKKTPGLCPGTGQGIAARLTARLIAAAFLCPSAAQAETIRIATYNTELSRDGPGLLLRDIFRGDDKQITAVAKVVARVSPDIIILQNIDYDQNLTSISALRDMFADHGANYPYIFATLPNGGLPTGLDLDGDGRLGEAEDNQGFGFFAGQGGMALLSRFPVDTDNVQDFTPMLWRDLPGAAPLAPELARVLRLTSNNLWVVPVRLGSDRLHLLAFHATPPVFGGPDGLNARRNRDELRFWHLYLDGQLGPRPDKRFVLLGDTNIDPVDGAGHKQAVQALLADPRLTDPRPKRAGAPPQQPGQRGPPQLDTAAWPTPDPGHLRVDFVLPSTDMKIKASGVYWPDEATPEGQVAATASRHRLVWVDLLIK